MDKDEILEKSRNDNKNQDERERSILSKSPYFGLMALFTVSTILAFYRKFGLSGASISDLLALGFLALTILFLADYMTQGW